MDPINILLLVSIFVSVYFFIVRPATKEKDRRKSFLESLNRGDRVIMVSGLCGYFYRFEDDKIVIETDERGHKLTFLKTAVAIEETRRLYESNISKKKNIL